MIRFFMVALRCIAFCAAFTALSFLVLHVAWCFMEWRLVGLSEWAEPVRITLALLCIIAAGFIAGLLEAV